MKHTLEHVSFSDGVSFYQPAGADWRKSVASPETRGEPQITPASYTHADDAEAIARALPGTWEASPIYTREPASPIALTREDGARVVLTFGTRYPSKGKWGAYYSRPSIPGGTSSVSVYDEAGNRLHDPQIAFSPTKTPEQIARDIARRLLPDAEKLHARVVAALAAQQAHLVKCGEAEACAARLRLPRPFYGFRASGETLEIRGFLTPAQAERLAALLKNNPLPEE